MSGVELAACPFCGGPCAVHHGEHSFFDAKVRCTGCNAEGPMFDVDDGNADESGRNEAKAIAAWNRRAVPMEAVAWRWRWPETNKWHYADYNLHPEAEEVQALALIPQAEET